MLQQLLNENLLDYIAMDVKAPFDLYDKLSGVKVNTDKIKESIQLIANSGIEYEFRTTWVKQLLSEEDINQIRELIPAESIYKIQEFKPEHAYDASLKE